jgi:cytochrome c553
VRRFLAAIGGVAAAVVAGGLLFAWSGLYSVAASKRHFAVTAWFLEFAMRNSVQTHAGDKLPPRLDDPRLIALGAGHYEGGCAPCHGAPGVPRNPIPLQMLPSPPYLADELDWTDAELFWIVQHGIKYAGMPAWVAPSREDEIWAVVAFLRAFPQLSPEQYRHLALGAIAELGDSAEEGRRLAMNGSGSGSLGACARCHGLDGEGGGSGAFPRLSIQEPAYIEAALKAYASGERASGIMQPAAIGLEPSQMTALADFYGRRRTEAAAGATQPTRDLESGQRLAQAGSPEAGIVPCDSCHGSARPPDVPVLAGQYEPFLLKQLRLFKNGVRGGSKAVVMRTVVDRLTDEQLAAAAAYYASLPSSAERSHSSAGGP